MWKLIRLKFNNNTAHFGELGIGLEQTSERVRSDTLFSAWVNSYARLYGGEEVGKLLQTFLNTSNMPVRFSSTFVYHEEANKTTYYLPKPLAFPRNYPPDDLVFFKKYKKLKYLPLDTWQKWYQGNGFSESDLEAADTYSKNFVTGKLPKVAIDRVDSSSNFYHTGIVQFNSENKTSESKTKSFSGLYFLLKFDKENKSLENQLYAALNLLAEEGIGGEKSSGAGRFEIIQWVNLPSQWQNVVSFQGKSHSLISLFWQPTLSDLENSTYEIIERGGWIGSSFSGQQKRRKKVQMFAEGSVFSFTPQGQLADVTPNGFKLHPIYRNGIALSLPIYKPSDK